MNNQPLNQISTENADLKAENENTSPLNQNTVGEDAVNNTSVTEDNIAKNQAMDANNYVAQPAPSQSYVRQTPNFYQPYHPNGGYYVGGRYVEPKNSNPNQSQINPISPIENSQTAKQPSCESVNQTPQPKQPVNQPYYSQPNYQGKSGAVYPKPAQNQPPQYPPYYQPVYTQNGMYVQYANVYQGGGAVNNPQNGGVVYPPQPAPVQNQYNPNINGNFAGQPHSSNPYYPPTYPPYSQPIYQGYPPTYPPNVQRYVPVISPEEQMRRQEKKQFKWSANIIGFGLLFFFLITTVMSVFIGVIVAIIGQGDIINDPAFQLLLNVVLTFFGFAGGAILIFLLNKSMPHKLVSYGLPQKGKFFAAVLTGMGFCYTANIVTSLLQTTLAPILPFSQAEVVLPDGILGFILSTLAVAVAPALLEEFLFRGAIMGSLLKYGKPLAIFTSALLFGLIHGNLVQIPFAFMVGLVLGFVVVETDSIWTAVAVHFLNNFISVCLDYLGRGIGDEGLEFVYMILLSTLIMVGFIGIYILSLKNKDLFKYEKIDGFATTGKKFGWFCSAATIIIFFVFAGLEVLMAQLMY